MFVGREAELQAAVSALDALAADGLQVLEVVGDPGIGKTRLLAEIVHHARSRGLRTLTGRATEFESEIPFAVFAEALDPYIQRHADLLTARLSAEDAHRLGTIVDGLPGRTIVPAGYAGERYRTWKAFRRLLEMAAEPDGLLLVLDDVHWCDAATIDLIDYLLRQPPAGPLLFAFAYRPAQVPARLAAAIGAASPGLPLLRLSLDPLSHTDVARLLGPDARPGETTRLARLSGGNPLYLDALRRYATTAGDTVHALDDLDPTAAGIPPNVRAALGAELAAAAPESRLVAAAAAIGGDECDPVLLSVIAELTEPVVLRGLDDLVARDLMQAVPGSGRFRFRHPLVRHVVYASTAAGWRLAAHARAAAHLERVGAPARARAHHVARSATAPDSRAAAVLVEAARAVGPQAPATAASWIQAALRLLPGDTTESGLPDRYELTRFLAERQAAGGDIVEARKTMDVVLNVLLAPGHPARPAAVCYTGLLLRLTGQLEEAEVLLAAELGHDPDPDLLLHLATYALMRGQLYEADEHLRLAGELAPGSAVAKIALAMRSMTGFAAQPAGQSGPAHGSSALLDTLSDEDIARRIEVCAWMCWSGLDVEGTSDSLRRLRRCRRVAVRFGHAFVLPYLLAMQALMLARLGRIGEAIRDADEAVVSSRMLAADEPLALALLTRCWLYRCAADDAAAISAGEQAVTAARVSRGWLSTARAMLAFARLATGDRERGETELIAAGGGPSLAHLYPHNRMIACVWLASLAAERGDPAAARRWAALAESVTGPGGGAVLLARASAEGVDDPARAAVLAERSAAALTTSELLVLAARAWLTAASLWQNAGDRQAAVRALHRAEDLVGRMDCPEIENAVQRVSRRLRPPAVTRAGLTLREGEIAAMIADGRSNTEIADRLHLSIRTVETHASRIYAKLGVTSRAAAVSRLVL